LRDLDAKQKSLRERAYKLAEKEGRGYNIIKGDLAHSGTTHFNLNFWRYSTFKEAGI